MPKKSLYISDDIDALIGAFDGESYSGRLSYLVALGALLVESEEITLPPAQLRLVADALATYEPPYAQGAEAVLRGAWHAVFDSAAATRKYPDLARQLAALPLGQQAAIYERARAVLANRS